VGQGRQPKDSDASTTCDWELHWMQFASEVQVAHDSGHAVAVVISKS